MIGRWGVTEVGNGESGTVEADDDEEREQLLSDGEEFELKMDEADLNEEQADGAVEEDLRELNEDERSTERRISKLGPTRHPISGSGRVTVGVV